jgi:acetyl-CoA C-acetyltransferase
MPGSVIVAGARTPIGKLSGSLASFRSTDLGAIAIRASLERAGVQPDQVDHVVMGQILQAGTGQGPARQAAAGAGIPLSVPANTINKLCLSGINALYLADQMIQAGDADIVVAGGQESMTQAPYLLPGARDGLRMGHTELLDSMVLDGLTCSLEHVHMGTSTDKRAAEASISRDAQDAFAAESHRRAAEAQAAGRFDDEITAVEIPQRKGDPLRFTTDEGVRADTTVETLGRLRGAFAADGTVTAGNASQISDGACALIVMSKAKAEALGVEPLAELVSYGMVAGPDGGLLHQPSGAIAKALAKAGLAVGDVDLFELNEAFAAVGLASMADLRISSEITNVNGGAIALGHPVGMSGARIVLSLIMELRRRGGGLGAAALCGGGGQGDAAILRVG